MGREQEQRVEYFEQWMGAALESILFQQLRLLDLISVCRDGSSFSACHDRRSLT